MATYYRTGLEVVAGTKPAMEEVKPKNGKSFSYEELREFVGGMVEIVPMPDGRSMVVNEEGKLSGLEHNVKASEEWMKQYPISQYPLNNDQTIVGNALLATDAELGE